MKYKQGCGSPLYYNYILIDFDSFFLYNRKLVEAISLSRIDRYMGPHLLIYYI